MKPDDNLTSQPDLKSPPCSDCGATVTWKKPPTTARLPSGWKRQKGNVYCPPCWAKRYILRAVTMPVASPLDCTWDELGAALRAMWSVTTQASNWMMTELYARDIRRDPSGDAKIPRMAPVYLYPEARRRFPAMPSQSIAALEQAIAKKYRAKRYDIIWTCAASLPNYRYPTPFGIPGQGWSVEIDDQQPIVSVRIGDQRLRLRLRSGARFHRQMAAVKQIVSGEAEQGQMDIYRHGQGKTTEIMVKMVAWLPRKAAREVEGTLVVRSTSEAILQAFNLKDEAVWSYHGDQLRRWIAEHKRKLQRLADDSKAELRPVPPFAEHRRLAVDKFHRRTSSATHEIAAMIVGYATRRKFAVISYDDSDQSFSEGLPWAELKRKIAEKADAAGIGFVSASTEATTETAPALADV